MYDTYTSAIGGNGRSVSRSISSNNSVVGLGSIVAVEFGFPVPVEMDSSLPIPPMLLHNWSSYRYQYTYQYTDTDTYILSRGMFYVHGRMDRQYSPMFFPCHHFMLALTVSVPVTRHTHTVSYFNFCHCKRIPSKYNVQYDATIVSHCSNESNKQFHHV